MPKTLKTDYLIIGSGAMGMAFADTLLSETDANMIIVDRFAKPGGHRNSAYPFVTLHQPSAFYGVSSKELSQGRVDELGWNKGLADLATGSEVMTYFEEVMQQTFLPSGRVEYFPLCDHKENGEFKHKLSGETYAVEYKKLVNCTYLNTTVPSTHTPNFKVAKGVNFMPLNDLPKLTQAPEAYEIIGGGKTGVDACLWLLQNGVNPDDINWVISRDAWMLDRKNTQVGEAFFFDTIGAQANQFEAIAKAENSEDMFDRLEACGYFVRLDPNVRPQMFHGATISQIELEQLRRIKNIIRMGHVIKIDTDGMVLNNGKIKTAPNTVFVDCSASAIKDHGGDIPVFNSDIITPQMVRSYQPVFSASFIAHIEASQKPEKEKNDYCKVVPLPDTLDDYMRMTLAFMMNQQKWGQDPDIRQWMMDNRLDGFSKLVANIDKQDQEKMAVLGKLRDNAMPAAMKLMQFIAAADTP